jgi:hypothetical protein
MHSWLKPAADHHYGSSLPPDLADGRRPTERVPFSVVQQNLIQGQELAGAGRNHIVVDELAVVIFVR